MIWLGRLPHVEVWLGCNNRYTGYLDKKGTRMGWLTPNFHTINSLYSFSGGTVLDFVDLSCLVWKMCSKCGSYAKECG